MQEKGTQVTYNTILRDLAPTKTKQDLHGYRRQGCLSLLDVWKRITWVALSFGWNMGPGWQELGEMGTQITQNTVFGDLTPTRINQD